MPENEKPPAMRVDIYFGKIIGDYDNTTALWTKVIIVHCTRKYYSLSTGGRKILNYVHGQAIIVHC